MKFIACCSLYISPGNNKELENLVDNQELPKLEIISIILMTFSFDSWVIL